MDRDQFLRRRRQGLGGSDIAAIIGLSPWRTPRDIYLDKKGLAEPEPETDAQYWGQVLEPIIAEEYSRRTGRKIERCNIQFQHPEHPFLIGNIDRVVCDNPGKRPVVKGRLITRRILECKKTSQYLANNWGEPGTDQIPEYYKAQVQWYIGITGAEVCDVAVLIGNSDFRIYTVYRDDDIIAYLFGAGVAFWREYIEKDTMPPARSIDDIENVFHGIQKARAFASLEITEKADRYKELDDQIKSLKAEQETLKVAICDHMGDAVELVAADSRKLCSWSAAKPTTKTDWKAVAEEMKAPAGIIAKHTTETMSARRFTISAK